MLTSAPALPHDPYMEWNRPGTNVPCCGGGPEGDCYQTQARFRKGEWYALRREDQQWIHVPANKIVDVVSPDGKAHLCASAPNAYVANPVPFCFVPPEGGV